ncbi:MAG: hypothetical protein WC523_05045 [Patescibacteria group bacterium]
MKTDIFKDQAICQSQKSVYKQHHGAVVIFKGKIVGKGYNKVLGLGVMTNNGIHAEIHALNNAPANCRKNSTVYVCRVSKKGRLVLSKPCHSCAVVMKKLGVKYVWYTVADAWKKMIL